MKSCFSHLCIPVMNQLVSPVFAPALIERLLPLSYSIAWEWWSAWSRIFWPIFLPLHNIHLFFLYFYLLDSQKIHDATYVTLSLVCFLAFWLIMLRLTYFVFCITRSTLFVILLWNSILNDYWELSIRQRMGKEFTINPYYWCHYSTILVSCTSTSVSLRDNWMASVELFILVGLVTKSIVSTFTGKPVKRKKKFKNIQNILYRIGYNWSHP